MRYAIEPLERRLLLASIAAGQTIIDQISAPGEQDTYTFAASAGDLVIISVGDPNAASGYHPHFQLRNPASSAVITADSGNGVTNTSVTGQYTVPAGGDGAYSIVISDQYGSGIGPYGVELYKVPGANVADREGDGGAIVSGQTRSTMIDRPGDIDAYTFAASAGDTFQVSVGDASANSFYYPHLEVIGPTGSVITAVGTSNGIRNTSVNAEYSVPASGAGTYTVIVSDHYAGGPGAYAIEMYKSPSNHVPDSDGDGRTIVSGQTVAANINHPGDVDAYTFTASVGDTFQVSVGDASTDSLYYPHLELIGPAGSIITTVGTSNGIRNTSVNAEYTVPAGGSGTYTVIVSDHYAGGPGAYVIEMYKAPGTNVPDSDGDGGTIVSGQTVAANINHPGDLDAYTFTASVGDTFQVSVGDDSANSFYYPHLEVIGPTGSIITTVSTSNGIRNTSVDVEYTVPAGGAGTYTAIVSDHYAGGPGAYAIEMYKAPATTIADSDGDGGAIASGQTKAGNINHPGDLDRFTISANAGETLEILVGDANAASAYHPHFQLLGPNGSILTTQSTGNGVTNTSLTYQYAVPAGGAGTYTVLVSDQYGSGPGAYQIETIKGPTSGTIMPTSLALNTPVVGRINTVGVQDSWTFFGRAGKAVSLLLNPGTNLAANFLGAFAPTLDYGSISLIAPDGTTVLATQSSNTAGQALTINGITLPSDGTYTVKVAAPAGNASATGNYIVGAYDTTQIVRSLDLNKPIVGSITTPFQLDLYTFAATANSQVRLQIASGSSASVTYTLTGPGNTVIFSDVSASTGLVNLQAGGSYVLSAQSSAGQIGKYGFTLLKTSQISLVAGTPFNGTSTGNDQAQLFALPTSSADPISLTLTDPNSADHNELYASFNVPPTRDTYDYGISSAGAGKSLVIPSSKPGTLYILVCNESVTPAPGSFTLLARIAPVILNSAAPSTGASNTTTTLTLQGAGFGSGAAVSLVAANNTAYPATSSVTDLPTQITATFAPGSVPAGTYSVRVTQGNSTVELSNVFTMVAQGAGVLTTHLEVPNPIGNHGTATLFVDYSNTGTAAMPAPLLILEASRPSNAGTGTVHSAFLTLDSTLVTSGFWTSATPQGFSGTIQILASGKTPGVLQPGESIRVPVYYAGWKQSEWNFADPSINFSVSAIQSDDATPVDWTATLAGLQPTTISNTAWSAMSSNLLTKLGATAGSYVQMLDNAAMYLGRIGDNVGDVQALWGFELQQADASFSAVRPSLTSTVDAAVAAPGFAVSFGRTFGNTITSRNRLGILGYGWSTPWESHANVASDGTVTIIGTGDSQEVFQPDGRHPGTYFVATGNHNTLAVDGNGGYLLTTPDGSTSDFAVSGRLNYVQDTNGNRITASYTGPALTALTHSSGQSIVIAYNANGLIASITESTGKATLYTYNAAKQLIAVQDFAGHTTGYAYSANGVATANALTTINSPGGVHVFFGYDTQGRLSSTHLDGNAQAITYGYSEGVVTSTDALNHSSTAYFDHNGQVAKAIDALGNASVATYDQYHNLIKITGPTGLTENYSYDVKGNVVAATDALGYTTRFAYGPLNRLTTLTDAKGNKTAYCYDSAGNVLATTYADATKSTSVFNPLGEAISFLNQNGQATTYTYNAAGQVTQASFSDGSSYTYTYDGHGNLLTAVDATGTTTFTYDNDRLATVTYPGNLFLSFTYNTDGQRAQMVDQSGFTTNYQYDATGRLSGLTDSNGGPVVTYTYDAAGRLSSKSNGNGTSTTYAYDANGNILHLINYAPNGTTVNSQFDYAYDALGNVATEATIDGTWTYTYDATRQLTHAVFSSTNQNVPNQDEMFNYDAMGNRTSTVINGTTTTYITNAMNRYTSMGGVGFTHDNAGNLLSDGTHTFTYNIPGNVTSVSSAGSVISDVYDALGNRTAANVNGQTTNYLIDPMGLPSITAAIASGTTTHYRYGLGLVASTNNGSSSYFDFNGIGSTADITNTSGAVVSHFVADAFGVHLYASGASSLFQFCGQFGVATEQSDIVNMRARVYSAATGRFVSDDPLALIAGDTNFQRYVGNNPLSGIDPFGTAEFWFNFAKLVTHVYLSVTSPTIPETFSLEPAAYSEERIAAETLKHELREGVIEVIEHDTELRVTEAASSLGEAETSLSLRTAERALLTARELELAAAGGEAGFAAGPLGAIIGFVGTLAAAYLFDHFVLPHLVNLIHSAEASIASVMAVDPNAKIGPGVGAAGYVAGSGTLPYKIEFENASFATAPAQQVTITDQLSSNFDFSTFQLTQIGFGDTNIVIPAGSQTYQTTLPITYAGQTFDVLIEAGIHSATGQVYANFFSLDPMTELPPSALAGFLPPEDGSGRGQGYISYTIAPKPGLPTGTQITNIATIIFDAGLAITTDQLDPEDASQGIDPAKRALITIDAAPPGSNVSALPPVNPSESFVVNWSGADDAGGSGVASYDVLISVDNGAYATWLAATTAISATYDGQYGHSYRFYSVAHDQVGNQEPSPVVADATTELTPTWLNASSGAVYGFAGSTGARTLTLTSGTFTFTADAGAYVPALNVAVGPLAQLTFAGAQHLGILNVSGLVTLAAGGSNVLHLESVSIAGSGVLDLKDHSLIVDHTGASPIGNWTGTSYSGLLGLIASGRDGGNWDGSGVITTMSAATRSVMLTTIGVAAASDVLTFNESGTAIWRGQTVNPTSVLIAYTFAGDADLDGVIDGDDFFRIDAQFATATAGDVNGDARVDADDYFILDSNYARRVTGGGHSSGDLNGDNVIDGDDFFLMDSSHSAYHRLGYTTGDFDYNGIVDADDYWLIDRNYNHAQSSIASLTTGVR